MVTLKGDFDRLYDARINIRRAGDFIKDGFGENISTFGGLRIVWRRIKMFS